MEGLPIQPLVELAKVLGLPGVMLILWYWDSRRQDAQMADHRQFMVEQRQMYENNVELVRATQDIARATQDIARTQQGLVSLNAERMQRLCDLIEKNQYCPNVRIAKDAKGPQ